MDQVTKAILLEDGSQVHNFYGQCLESYLQDPDVIGGSCRARKRPKQQVGCGVSLRRVSDSGRAQDGGRRANVPGRNTLEQCSDISNLIVQAERDGLAVGRALVVEPNMPSVGTTLFVRVSRLWILLLDKCPSV